MKKLFLFLSIGIPATLWIIIQLFLIIEKHEDNKTVSQISVKEKIKDNSIQTIESIGNYPKHKNICDTIYELGETLPSFKGGKSKLLEFNYSRVIPVLSDFHKEEGYFISKLYYTLIISNSGKIIEVEIKTDMPNSYKDKLKKTIFDMPNWIPGELNGEKVCMKYHYPISCIKWE